MCRLEVKNKWQHAHANGTWIAWCVDIQTPAQNMLHLHEVHVVLQHILLQRMSAKQASFGLYRINYHNGNLKAKAHRDLGRDGFTNDYRHYPVTIR